MTNQTTAGLHLIISDKPDLERDALADAFARGGGAVHRLGRFWAPPAFDPATVRVYGADSFCLVLQQKLGFALCSPADDLLLQVPPRLLQRQVTKRTLAEAESSLLPAFVKPVTPKQFRGAVCASADELAEECRSVRLCATSPRETELTVGVHRQPLPRRIQIPCRTREAVRRKTLVAPTRPAPC